MALELKECDRVELISDGKPGDPTTAGGGGGGGGVDARERHKLAERERRKSMRELFLSLHALLPHANTVRKEQSAILQEIINYVPLAVARLRSLQNRKESPNSSHSSSGSPSPVPLAQVLYRSSVSSESEIRVSPEPSSTSVSISIRGYLVNVSLLDSNPKGTSQLVLPVSAILDELEAHHLQLVRSTHCREGSKILHDIDCKVFDGWFEKFPAQLNATLQQLASKLHRLSKSSSSSSSSTLKRTFDKLD